MDIGQIALAVSAIAAVMLITFLVGRMIIADKKNSKDASMKGPGE